jgi:hypothetical protein
MGEAERVAMTPKYDGPDGGAGVGDGVDEDVALGAEQP